MSGQDDRAAHAGTLLAVDGNSLVHRSFHAQAHTGQPSWAVRGLLTQLVHAVERVRPVAVVVGFDDPDASTRRDRWPQYKANRAEKLDTLVAQLAAAATALRDLGVAVVVPPGLEADDVLCSTAAVGRAAGLRTVVVTSDRDAFALIDDTTSVLRIIDGGVEASPLMTPERLVMLLGVHPRQYRDFAALRGDPSDNLPGVRGVGPRTAARLLAEFGTAAAAFDDPAAVRERLGGGVANRLAAEGARAAWELNCQVMTMHDDVDLGLDLTGGPGVLPLPAGVVESVYRSYALTWGAGAAVRVLAETETDAGPTTPVVVDAPGASGASGAPGSWWPTSAPRRAPRLPAKPKDEQLALF